ncbi:hypothetical protein H9Q13_01975 [Pontibacter sp. JH31]|uniref:Lipoprotein n=1 Tax=Pontibacter aquaedesilientis TaxID=2766980 RepID=A0ABR7XC85_9BACT|nr:hypothetical protein [Pontibacter aquaedesilientis]MBD1395919.1 hypothetical protein [Pontibacter aquaedesilientis]
MRYPLFIFCMLTLVACNSKPNKAIENKTDHTQITDTDAQSAENTDTITQPAEDELQHFAIDTTDLAPEPKTAVKLLTEGRFHKREVWQGVEKKQWLGLVFEDSTFRLRPVRIQVQPFFDPVNDKGKQVMSGREVSSEFPNTLLLIAGIDQLKAGPVDTVGYPDQAILPNTAINLKYKGKTYTLEARGDSIKDESSASYSIRNYSWKISGTKQGRKISQVLATDEDFESAIYVLLWAGDLDHDGIPDLLTDLSSHYNTSQVTLFLSSKADKGKLYKKVASFKTEAYPAPVVKDISKAPAL